MVPARPTTRAGPPSRGAAQTQLAELLESVPAAERRLLGSAGVYPGRVEPGSLDSFQLLELGARWYDLAVWRSAAPSASVQALQVVAEHVADARRILDVVTDHHLFRRREQWFGRPAA